MNTNDEENETEVTRTNSSGHSRPLSNRGPNQNTKTDPPRQQEKRPPRKVGSGTARKTAPAVGEKKNDETTESNELNNMTTGGTVPVAKIAAEHNTGPRDNTGNGEATPRIDDGTPYPVGTRVKKYFYEYSGWYEGIILEYNPITLLYTVEYTDGDQEDLDHDEINTAPFPTVPLFPVGRPIQQYFTTKNKPQSEKGAAAQQNLGWLAGTIIARFFYVPSAKSIYGKKSKWIYQVEYADHDTELLDESRVRRIVERMEQQQRGNTSKKPKPKTTKVPCDYCEKLYSIGPGITIHMKHCSQRNDSDDERRHPGRQNGRRISDPDDDDAGAKSTKEGFEESKGKDDDISVSESLSSSNAFQASANQHDDTGGTATNRGGATDASLGYQQTEAAALGSAYRVGGNTMNTGDALSTQREPVETISILSSSSSSSSSTGSNDTKNYHTDDAIDGLSTTNSSRNSSNDEDEEELMAFDENVDSHPVPDRDATVAAQLIADVARASVRTRKVSHGGGGQQDQIVVATEQEPKKLLVMSQLPIDGVAPRASRRTRKALFADTEIDDAKSMDDDDDDSNNGMARRDGSVGNVPKTSNTAEATAAATAEMLGIKNYDSSSSSDDDGGATSGSDKDLDAPNTAAAKAKKTTAFVVTDDAIGHGAADKKEVFDVDGDKNGKSSTHCDGEISASASAGKKDKMGSPYGSDGEQQQCANTALLAVAFKAQTATDDPQQHYVGNDHDKSLDVIASTMIEPERESQESIKGTIAEARVNSSAALNVFMSEIAKERVLIDGEVQNAKKELTESQKQNADHVNRIRELEAAIDKQKTDHKEEITTVRSKLEEKVAATNALQKDAIGHNQEINKLHAVIDDRDISIRQRNDANKLLESSLEAEQKEHKAVLARLTDFQIAAIGSEQEIKRLLLVIDDRDSSIRQGNEDLLASQAIDAGFQKTINELQTNLDNKQRRMDQLMQQRLDQQRNESDN